MADDFQLKWDANNEELYGYDPGTDSRVNIPFDSIETGALLGDYPETLRVIKNGSVISSIDPANTSTPFADAISQLGSDGTIQLPADTFTDATSGGVNIPRGTTLKTYGPETTRLEFTDLSSDGVVIDGSEVRIVGGMTISGSDQNNRSAGSGLSFTSAHESFDIAGTLNFDDWGSADPVIKMNSGHPFSSHWDKIRVGGTNSGPPLQAQDSIGPGLDIGMVQFSPSTKDICFDLRSSSGGTISDCGVNIGIMNIGTDAGPVVNMSMSGNSVFVVNAMNTFNSPSSLIKIRGGAQKLFGAIDTAPSATVDQVVEFYDSYHGNASIGHIGKDATINNNVINVKTDGNSPHIYHGSTGGVSNNSGGTLSGSPVSCLSDLSQVN